MASWEPLPVPHAYTPPGAPSHSVVLIAGDAARTTLRLTTGDATSPWGVAALDWPGATREVTFSGPRGTLGERPVSSRVGNGQLRLGLRLLPGGMDDASARLSDLAHIVDLMGRMGGQVTVRRTGQTFRQHFQVMAGTGVQFAAWDPQSEIDGRQQVALALTCSPYILWDPMEIEDGFDTATAPGDYMYDQGTAGDVMQAQGQLAPASAGVSVRALPASGHVYGDVRVGVTLVPGGVLSGFKAGVILKRITATTYLEAYIDDDGTVSRVRLDKVVAGARTNLSSTNLPARLTAGTPTRLFAALMGGTVYIAWAARGTVPDSIASTDGTTTVTLTTGDASVLGGMVQGSAGWVWTPKATAATLDDFTIHPFAVLTDGAPVWEVTPNGVIPGDAPALVRVEVSATLPGAAHPGWALLAVTPRPSVTNLVPNGLFEMAQTGTPTPWGVTAVSGVTGAATSIAYDTTAPRWGTASGRVTCPATANTGAWCLVRAPGGFQQGRTYTLWAWVKSTTATPARLRLGVSGDIASSVATALPSGWTEWTVQWTPTGTVPHAYVAAEITTAAATTFNLDGVVLVEGTTKPAAPSQAPSGRGGAPPTGIISPTAAVTRTGFTLASTGAYWPSSLGQTLRASSGTTATAAWVIDPEAMDAGDHQDTMDVEVWAVVITPATFTAGTVTVTCGTAATREYGAAGLTLPAGKTGLWRLSTIPIARDRGTAIALQLAFAWTAITGNLDVPMVLLVPAGGRVISGPTGKAGGSFLPAGLAGASAVIRTDPDGRGFARGRWGNGWAPSASMDRTLEAPPGPITMLGAVLQDYPDGGNSTSAPYIAWRRLSPLPRSHFMRPA